jgi:hypothetical protein
MPTNKKTITFETKCWENDWESIIKNGGYQRKLLSFKDNQFDKKILIINNVNDVALVCSEADKLVKQQIIDEWFLVDDYKEEVLNYFNIDFNSFKGGYYYSISELVSIYLSNTDYLLHLSSDTNVEINHDSDWVNVGVNIMEKNSKVICANPVWNHSFMNAKSDSKGDEDNDWFYIQRFSDQCYLIPLKHFKEKIYNEHNDLSDIHFPKYGGELFEKRVYSHIMNNDLTTITNKRITYMHPNYF